MKKNNLVRFKNWNTPPHFVALPQAKLCGKKQKTCLCWDNSLILGKTHQCLLLLRFLCFWVYRKWARGVLESWASITCTSPFAVYMARQCNPSDQEKGSSSRRCTPECWSWWFTLEHSGSSKAEKQQSCGWWQVLVQNWENNLLSQSIRNISWKTDANARCFYLSQ